MSKTQPKRKSAINSDSPLPTYLYRHFDANGVLLYIGVSLSFINRLQQHEDSSFWANQIRVVKAELFSNRRAAIEAETEAIREERPKHNTKKVHSPDPSQQLSQADPRGLSAREFGDRMGGLSDNKVHMMISSGEVRSLKIGDRRIIPESEVGRILAQADFSAPAEPPQDGPRGRGRPPKAAGAE
jgi:predicted GIY-YIG superfamily endonuclease